MAEVTWEFLEKFCVQRKYAVVCFMLLFASMCGVFLTVTEEYMAC